jgi:hypothetical protein
MKTSIPLLAVLAGVLLVVSGCGSKINTSNLEKSFAPAETALKDTARRAADAVKGGDYGGALKELQMLAGNAKLTEDQKKAVSELLDQVKKALADAGNKALGDAQKALPK